MTQPSGQALPEHLREAPHWLAEPPRAGWLDALIAIPSLWGLTIAAQLGLLAIFGTEPTAAMLLTGGLFDAVATTALCTFFIAWRHKLSFTRGFRIAWLGWKPVILAVGLGLTAAVLATVVMNQFSTGDSMMAKLTSTTEGLIAVSVMALLMPVVEELYYRGFIYTILEKELTKQSASLWPVAVIVVATWFGAIHVPQLIGDWIAIPVVAGMGLIWTLMRRHYRSLLPSMLSHLTYNGTLIGLSWLSILLEGA